MSKIRKKDPCPCGSGKRYKDCCLKKKKGKGEIPQKTSSRLSEEELGEIFDEKKFQERLNEFVRAYAEGTLKERIKESLESGWECEKVEEMSTEEIIEKLDSMNVHFNKDQFKKQVQQYISAIELAEDHYYTQDWKGKEDEDFIWIAVMELWNQLIPDKVNLEMVDSAIFEGYFDLDRGDYTRVLEQWENAWDMVKKIIPPEITAIEEADRFISSLPVFRLTYSLFDWCQDFMDFYNGDLVPLYSELEDESWIKKRIVYVTEFCEQFPDTDDTVIEPMLRTEAVSCALLGDREKAEPLFEGLVERFPDSALTYICWGDMYVIVDPPDYDKAEKIYRRGLTQCPGGRNEIFERIKDLKEKIL
ncbi:MAG: SEC-C domain-containing protein [Theionarchaea archaeon]|nr:MAG: hypothetical protein AYK18_04720 [Theionarchaea archaeon DG-70]MBU7012013.1 SEC-C domain-containing protein [Theionarchaea archaeon]